MLVVQEVEGSTQNTNYFEMFQSVYDENASATV
jgi:hypothetical protein